MQFRALFVGKINANCGPVSMYSYGPSTSEVKVL